MEELIAIIKKVNLFKAEAEKTFGTSTRPKRQNSSSNFDIGIVTATPIEFETVKALFSDVEQFEVSDDDSNSYFSCSLGNATKQFKIVFSYPLDMGIPSVVNTTSKIITNFHPNYLFLVGIAAGNKSVNNIGDILIAEKSLNYNEVVEIEKSDHTTLKKFMQNSDSINRYFKSKLNQFANSTWIKQIQDDYPGKQKIEKALTCKLGLLVTGSSLVRSQLKVTEISQSHHNVIGLDMETTGFYYAAAHTLKAKAPYFASIKSVSDFGDNTVHKLSSDERRNYALYTSSNALRQFILNYL